MDVSLYLSEIENELNKCCDEFLTKGSKVAESVKYSLLNGGKRTRALFILLTAEMCGANRQDYLRFACGVEMIHCYSLIHDDLPCMDNDDYRRGKPSNHRVFGEGTAMLAGDALAGLGLEVIANAKGFSSDDLISAVRYAANAMGPKGMIYGQELDLEYENSACGKDILNLIHKNKTGAMISLCGKLGSIGCDLSDKKKKAIDTFLANSGLVFQIVDDILDVEGDEKLLGKPVGSDMANEKTTFVKLYGLQGSKDIAEKLTKEAEDILYDAFSGKSDKLIEYTHSLLHRNK